MEVGQSTPSAIIRNIYRKGVDGHLARPVNDVPEITAMRPGMKWV